jgi:hypothetical protein
LTSPLRGEIEILAADLQRVEYVRELRLPR